ncbi:uncharacterized protein LOC122067405 [Macadamia integrifolia]|uniref:uncharacterized protein LOC122067405 n=1 Tax=Macadamia integrifolia TaxID=60698 RepID=UPI001C4EDBAE|nr:uncharacterized protein LOC122067405 [Macadamia integrifolia]XP_042487180.1 uncharacterized protein LOC122067405 [Macadamia integrifolia]XP_042487181.1 uncharacterized protein LOC122067405 [Macadamia integrifolia]XP_042487182.1 uncharacterized protein LOC122067405 [Macadamia integrifolia]XP_042487183.1 uncharacterized protein LOC122067405 [Macadamia integrifolia]
MYKMTRSVFYRLPALIIRQWPWISWPIFQRMKPTMDPTVDVTIVPTEVSPEAYADIMQMHQGLCDVVLLKDGENVSLREQGSSQQEVIARQAIQIRNLTMRMVNRGWNLMILQCSQ